MIYEFNGARYCETRISPLVNGQSDTGYVEHDNWNYFTYVTNTANNFDINVISPSSSQDCDIYVKAGSIPSRQSYDYHDIGTSSNVTLTIPDPAHQTWNIGIYGWTDCSFTITAFETSQCADDCNGRGDCDVGSGVCTCYGGWTGVACEYALIPINNGISRSDSVAYGSWDYYSFNVNSSALYILVKETSSTGLVWVYVAKSYPTIRQYLYSDTQTNTNTHVIAIELSAPETVTYQIGVYANPFTQPNQNIAYQIVAWSPNF